MRDHIIGFLYALGGWALGAMFAGAKTGEAIAVLVFVAVFLVAHAMAWAGIWGALRRHLRKRAAARKGDLPTAKVITDQLPRDRSRR